MGRLSILIAPGASVLPEGYQLVTDALKARGYDGEALPIPSVGVPGNLPKTPPTMYDDAAFIASRVTELADNGKDVILIGHSYGGTPITECVKGLAKTDRERQGLKGGIIGLAYMAALIPEMGHPAGSVQAHLPAENKVPVECDENGWLYYTDIPRLASLLYSNMSQEEGKKYAAKLTRHSAASFGSPLTYAGYKDVPVSYLFCEDDLVVTPAIQRAGIDMIERETGEKVQVTNVKADHAAPLSLPEAVNDWILDVIRRLEQS